MTSLEIAELTGKQHKNLMQAIRNMEPAWGKVTQSKFGFSTYKDATGRTLPCYILTKTECLYIATKFNDEARAKLVLRWQELEMEDVRRKMSDVRCLPSPQKILAMADEIIGEGLRMLNDPAEDTLTATQVAKTFNMTESRGTGTLIHAKAQWQICLPYDSLIPSYQLRAFSTKSICDMA